MGNFDVLYDYLVLCSCFANKRKIWKDKDAIRLLKKKDPTAKSENYPMLLIYQPVYKAKKLLGDLKNRRIDWDLPSTHDTIKQLAFNIWDGYANSSAVHNYITNDSVCVKSELAKFLSKYGKNINAINLSDLHIISNDIYNR